jgi:D-arabinose 1-dehydrogenase-like Zn-dependent alcohol dehydrogenase
MSQTVVKCYWAPKAKELLVPSTITRRAPSPTDVVIAIQYTGVCHTDIHKVCYRFRLYICFNLNDLI